MTFKKLYSISFDFYEDSYNENLEKLIDRVEKCEENSIIVAPELCLTNFSFDNLQKSAKFGKKAIEEIKRYSKNKVITFSLTTQRDGKFYNSAITLYQKQIVHSQDKYKLFKFGNEDRYFTSGEVEKIKIFEINGIKFAILICFEIRFITLWQRIQGADVIMIPALWGKLRKKQLEIISQAMGVINQAYVIVANSKNSDMASSSAIITPFGERVMDDNKDILQMPFLPKEIKKMRKYMDIGLPR